MWQDISLQWQGFIATVGLKYIRSSWKSCASGIKLYSHNYIRIRTQIRIRRKNLLILFGRLRIDAYVYVNQNNIIMQSSFVVSLNISLK